MDQMTFPVAFFAGLISFLSPCVLPLVPPYLVYLSGTTLDALSPAVVTKGAAPGKEKGAEARDRRVRAQIVLTSLLFVLGFTTVFVALGASASVVGQFVRSYSREFAIVAGIIIIIMGLHFLGLFRLALLHREARLEVKNPSGSWAGAYLMGLAFGFGWTPCIGPILSVILAVAATGDTVGYGAFLLAVYALGLGVPFILAAAFSGPAIGLMKRFRQHMAIVERVMGGLLVAAGVLFLTGYMARFSYWLLETFPVLAQFG